MTVILTDADLVGINLMPAAVEAIEAALRARALGAVISPPRLNVPFGDHGDLVFTVGGRVAAPRHAGFRVYDTFRGAEHTQIVAVWSLETAKLECVVLGSLLGELRTGAIGGVAIRHMSAPEADSAAVIGSGRQARMQLEAAAAVRRLRRVRVFSPTADNRERFATEMSQRLDLPVEPVDSVEEAVLDAEIVICATTSEKPVLEARWLRSGAHVNSVGPKTIDAHELGLDVVEAAAIIATDSPEQTRAYDRPFFLQGTGKADRLVDLSRLVDGTTRARPCGQELTLFCSVGLAGTEVLVGAALLPLLR